MKTSIVNAHIKISEASSSCLSRLTCCVRSATLISPAAPSMERANHHCLQSYDLSMCFCSVCQCT